MVAAFALVGTTACGSNDPPSLPPVGNPMGFRRILTPEIAEGVRVGERFTMYTAGLTAIELRASAVGPPRGKVWIDLRGGKTAEGAVVRSTEVSAADFAGADVYRFEFPPISNSKNMQFVLEITSAPDAPAGGVALWSTKGERNPEDVLLFNGAERFGDLVYQTDVFVPPKVVSPLRPAIWLALVALALSWIAVAVMIRQMAPVTRST
jgi:hypothetical protein